MPLSEVKGMVINMKNTEKQYEYAKEYYAGLGIDTDKVLKKLEKIPVSIHCWQGDDVAGFEESGAAFGGGILATGNFKGRARYLGELQQDIEKAFSLIPGAKKVNLHPIYGDFKGNKVDRNEITVEHFKNWAGWAESNSRHRF